MKIATKKVFAVVPLEFQWVQDAVSGVSELLAKKSNKWDLRLNGIPKAFRKIKINESKAKILEEPGLVLVKASYTVDYYSPAAGEKVVGTVKNWSASEIGVLVDVFNAVVSSGLGSYENSAWKDSNKKDIVKNTKVRFTLEK